MVDSNNDTISIQLDKFISEVHTCIDKCQTFQSVPGMPKLERKFQAEKKFLKSLRDGRRVVNENYMRSSNLTHLKSIIEQVEEIGINEVDGILVPFKNRKNQLLICDILYNESRSWMKVISRNAQALHLIWRGNGLYGMRSIISPMKQYLETAKDNPINYKIPEIIFYFVQGVTVPLAEFLTNNGITIKGSIVDVSDEIERRLQMMDDDCSDDEQEHEVEEEEIIDPIVDLNSSSSTLQLNETSTIKLNLDVSTLISLASELTADSHIHKCQSYWLEVPAELERCQLLLPLLEDYMKGKELYVCQTAYDEFNDIIQSIGGENEKIRAKELLENMTLMPDCPSERAMALQESVKIKPKTKVIFGSGDTIKAITMTANRGFVRAASEQVKFFF
ncbi:unnamed protein product [Didymodactylos carnosus]|uniref:DUF1308 domain-containing protein n=1 Tax=Didymodactylos carnosus TaxID=1234261 RepID=A0A813QLF4_9BILA|nr:unnamed protein product [Didymodactylos carnosus]CAF0768563.1 unnamed protein product [Didymodactylos carnosus]CAF3503543.1 unnamed protein product [Didymodactylos carnosus]CAF3550382.1 unnamed protein product [Didymodactylos carnosus]